jgi:hypothetical protein
MKEGILLMHYPDGGTQRASRPIRYGALLDVNGNELELPLSTSRMLVYRVWKATTEETRNEMIRHYFLEQVAPSELEDWVR